MRRQDKCGRYGPGESATGGFAAFRCMNCGYTEQHIGFGRGKNPEPRLQLYRCDHCKTVGSTWVKSDEKLRCGACYDEIITLLEPENSSFNCPKCDTLAVFSILDNTWE